MQAFIEPETFVQLLLDCTGVISGLRNSEFQGVAKAFEKLSKRLCYTLHTEGYKRLNLIPKRNLAEKAAVVHSSVKSRFKTRLLSCK